MMKVAEKIEYKEVIQLVSMLSDEEKKKLKNDIQKKIILINKE